jgi:hypothetical protein
MIAIHPNDICLSTNDVINPAFNTDGKRRTELTVEEARTALDFNIVKCPTYDRDGRRIPSLYHLQKDTDQSFIPCTGVGEKFTPVQHRDIFDYIATKVMPQVPDLKLELCGTIHGGGVGLIAAQFGDTFSLPGDKSPNKMRLFFSNPSNGTGSLTLGFTTVRVVCENTLRAATREAKADGWTIRHTQSAPELTKNAVKAVQAQAVAALEMKRRSERLARIGVGRADIEKCLDAIYPVEGLPDGFARTRLLNIRDAVMEQFESGATAQTMTDDTAWKLFNSFTYPVFNPERLPKNKDRAEIQYRSMVGETGDKVLRMFEAIEMAVA